MLLNLIKLLLITEETKSWVIVTMCFQLQIWSALFRFPLGHSTETKQAVDTLEMNSLHAPLTYVQPNKHDFNIKYHWLTSVKDDFNSDLTKQLLR